MRQLNSIVKDEIDKSGEPSQAIWDISMTEHTILDIYGSKLMELEETAGANSLPTLP